MLQMSGTRSDVCKCPKYFFFFFFFLKKNNLESGSCGKVLKALKKASSLEEDKSDLMASSPRHGEQKHG